MIHGSNMMYRNKLTIANPHAKDSWANILDLVELWEQIQSGLKLTVASPVPHLSDARLGHGY